MAKARRRSGPSIGAALVAVAIAVAALAPIGVAEAAAPIAGLTQISAGGNHTCAVTTSGGVKCWGRNSSGQLGDRTIATRLTPTNVFDLSSGIAEVESGGAHSCARTTSGTVDCWGLNTHGQAAPVQGSSLLKPSPVPFPSHAVTALALGGEHSCALLDNGDMRCWGRNDQGQLGIGTTVTGFSPKLVTTGVRAIAAFGKHTCALMDATGGVKCWGLNDHGQAGDGTTTTPQKSPVDVSGLTSGVEAIALGEQTSCALTVAGAVKCWGANAAGQLGNGTGSDSRTPVAVSGLSSGVDDISAGGGTVCALSSGALQCWGSNSSGQVGDDTTQDRLTPFTVPLGTGVVSKVTVGLAHACLQLVSGGTKCWGENGSGQLGDGTLVDLYSPFAPDPPTGVSAKPSSHTAVVSWKAPKYDGGSPLTKYVVTSSPATTSITVTPPRLSATFTGLTNGVAYTFTVTATNDQGLDSRRSVPSARVYPGGPPGAPSQLGVTTGNGRATISWHGASNNGSPLTSYRVVATPGSRSATVSGSGTKATVTGLTNGVTYTFTVHAYNQVGIGPGASITKKLPLAKSGYWMLGANGGVYPFGNSQALGSASYPSWSGGVAAVAMSVKRDGSGYWVVDSLGGVHAFGTARNFGQYPALNAGESVSTIASTPSGGGYWLFTNRGRAVPYGNAHFFGDMSGASLNGPVIASTATPTGNGYFMVASDGGVFTFGDAHFHGSTGAIRLNKPVVGLSPTPSNGGYWLVASDGGVFAFGDASFRGSMGGAHLNRAVNGLVPFGNGYLMVASDGGVFNFSNKPFYGSLGSNPPPAPIIGIAAFTH